MPDEMESEQKLLTEEHESEVEKGSEGKGEKSGATFRVLLLICSLLVFLLVAMVAVYFVRSRMAATSSPDLSAVPSAVKIVLPVPKPDCREMLDFLIAYKVQGQEVITSLRMEAVFESFRRYADFKNEPVVFRQTVYDFLLHQNAPDNTKKSWQAVFGQNLLDYLRVKLPDCCPDKIRLTQIENL
ncbi:MAG: hypothetical protein ACP5SH_00835 [Syntrophobacteraceae bacterium]